MATKRIYVHFTNQEPGKYTKLFDHTVVTTIDAKTLGSDLRKQFIKDYNAERETDYTEIFASALIHNTKWLRIEDDELVEDLLQDRDDVHLIIKREHYELSNKEKPSSSIVSSDKKASLSTPAKSTAVVPSSTTTSSSKTDPEKSFTALELTAYRQLTTAKAVQDKGQLRKAREIYLAVLKSVKGSESSKLNSIKQICYQQLGAITLHNKFYDQATGWFRKAIDVVEQDKSGRQNTESDLAILRAFLGQALFGDEEYQEAAKIFNGAISGLKSKKEKHDIQVWLARSLLKLKNLPSSRQSAVGILEQILREDDHHIGALGTYGAVAADCGQGIEAIPHILRALVTAASTKDTDPSTLDFVKETLTDVVKTPEGVKGLLGEIHSAAQNVSALTFLAQTIKDKGAILSSIELYAKAVSLPAEDENTNTNAVLNLVHTLEVAYKYQEAFSRIQSFLKESPRKKVGDLKAITFYDAIKNIKDIFDPALRSGDSKLAPKYTELPVIFDAGFMQVLIPPAGTEEDGKLPKKRKDPEDDTTESETKKNVIKYPDNELNLLALYFTAVKILFVCGALQVIPTLVHLLEPLRRDRELHLTTIRNEHAYYSCISQVMSKIPYPILIDNEPKETIYVCGDSHCLSSAWQKLELKSGPVLLTPKLVTGLKCWHLRPECRFYPKANFEFALQTIPNQSTVIFVFGEIDCREGILIAIEKGKYETLEQGIKESVSVYKAALEDIVKKKQLKAYVHPVVPVLDLTRNTVKAFNKILKASLASSKNLTYLDFFDKLLLEDGVHFNTDYHMDGTHMSPSYLHLVTEVLGGKEDGKKQTETSKASSSKESDPSVATKKTETAASKKKSKRKKKP